MSKRKKIKSRCSLIIQQNSFVVLSHRNLSRHKERESQSWSSALFASAPTKAFSDAASLSTTKENLPAISLRNSSLLSSNELRFLILRHSMWSCVSIHKEINYWRLLRFNATSLTYSFLNFIAKGFQLTIRKNFILRYLFIWFSSCFKQPQSLIFSWYLLWINICCNWQIIAVL